MLEILFIVVFLFGASCAALSYEWRYASGIRFQIGGERRRRNDREKGRKLAVKTSRYVHVSDGMREAGIVPVTVLGSLNGSRYVRS